MVRMPSLMASGRVPDMRREIGRLSPTLTEDGPTKDKVRVPEAEAAFLLMVWRSRTRLKPRRTETRRKTTAKIVRMWF